MIGILVQLLLSWGIIWLFEKGDLAVLGLYPTRRRLLDFVVFFIITTACAALGFFMRMYFGERWELNPAFTCGCWPMGYGITLNLATGLAGLLYA
jgi:CAAX protease family protein